MFSSLLLTALLTGPQATAAPAQTAIFAGGCFWCVESDFDKIPGVLSTKSGYIGGTVKNPSYKQVSAGGTGHKEAVEIKFDPDKVSYNELLEVYWHSVDPTDAGGQFCDRGESYTTAVFTTTPQQFQEAKASKLAIEKERNLKTPVVTPITQAPTFYAAEDYHQDFYKKNPLKYKFYRYRCGRDARVNAVWGDEAYKGIK
nr:peptide-methionine (S)-S-oxide reductase MsrA [Pseudovibrio sp. M1P-2-3]